MSDQSKKPKSTELTHLDSQGKVKMVDVGEKPVTQRSATASARIRTRRDVIEMIGEGRVPKGDVSAVARIAGILAAKKTSDLIPLCHPIPIDAVEVQLELHPEDELITISATAKTTNRTGVEMEALTAASAAALTVYDMCKAVDREMTIESIQLEEKTGGRSGHFQRKG